MRIRSIKPEFFKHDKLAELSPIVRILFIGLWGLADSEGRMEDRPKRIKAEVLPYDDGDIDAMLSELHAAGFIVRYTVDAQKLIEIPSFRKHQRITGKEFDLKSVLPARTTGKRRGNTRETPEQHPESLEGKGRERKGKEQGEEGSGERAPGALVLPRDLDTPEFRDLWAKYIEHRRQKKKPLTGMAAEMQIRQLAEMGLQRALLAIPYSIAQGWQGIFEPNGHTATAASAKAARRAGEYAENLTPREIIPEPPSL